MEFLKEVLGDEFYKQIESKITEYNKDKNKEEQIKLANLSTGDFVSSEKYKDLQSTIGNKDTEISSANELIKQLKEGINQEDEALQTKISDYETQNEKLKKELDAIKLNSAIKLALLEEKAEDVDYLTYKLNESLSKDDKKLEIDDNNKIKGIEDLVSGLKEQYPKMFDSHSNSDKQVDTNKLPDSENQNGLTKAELLNKPYSERMKIYEENTEAYNKAMNG